MKKARLFHIVLLVYSVLFFSCDSGGFLLDETEGGDVVVKTVPEGGIVLEGETLPLAVNYDETVITADRLEVLLLGPDGTVLAEDTLEGAELERNQLPDLALPDGLEPDLYSLRFTLVTVEGDKVFTDEVPFFFVQGNYDIVSIASYPPVVKPGSQSLVHAELKVPPGSNPYLRWTVEGTVQSEGYLQDGMDILEWESSSRTGVYPITLELFPLGPAKGISFQFSSSLKMNTEVYISDSVRTGKYELYPETSYAPLFHFRGNYNDVTGKHELSPQGDMSLAFRENLFGYYLNGESWFTLSSSVFPLQEARPAPFSLVARILPEELQKNRTIFTGSTEGFSLRLGTDNLGQLTASIETGGGTGVFTARGLVLEEGQECFLVFSLRPVEEGLEIHWFLNGESAPVGILPLDELPLISEKGSTRIGGSNGEKGFTGIIDEFGVYTSLPKGGPGFFQDVYKYYMETRLGSSVVFAEGFEAPGAGRYPILRGRTKITEGSLRLGSGAEAELPAISPGSEETSVELNVEEEGAGRLTFLDEMSGDTLAVLDFTGGLSFFDGTSGMVPKDDGSLLIHLRRDGSDLVFSWKENSLVFTGPWSGKGLRLHLENPGNRGTASLDSILITVGRIPIGQDDEEEEERIVKGDPAASPG